MHPRLSVLALVLTLVLALAGNACSSGQSSSPATPVGPSSTATQASKTNSVAQTEASSTSASRPLPSTTIAPSGSTAVTQASSPAPAATAAGASASGPISSTAPTASPTAETITAGELKARASAINEFSFTHKVTFGSDSSSTKGYVKGSKSRYEFSAGARSVILVDSAKKQAYRFSPGETTAENMDFDEALAVTQQPDVVISSLADSAKPSGFETIDNKQAAIFDADTEDGPIRYWLWIDKGLPLKTETTSPQGKVTVEYQDYQFGPLDDSLFELPAGAQVSDLP